jgi:hypothetical protein
MAIYFLFHLIGFVVFSHLAGDEAVLLTPQDSQTPDPPAMNPSGRGVLIYISDEV